MFGSTNKNASTFGLKAMVSCAVLALVMPVFAQAAEETTNATNVEFFGTVNNGVMYIHDGRPSTLPTNDNGGNLFIVDNANDGSKLGVRANSTLNNHLTVGADFSAYFIINSSDAVSQNDTSIAGGTSFTRFRIGTYADTGMAGKFSLGYGDTASENTAESDLSGTFVVANSDVQSMGGAVLFRDHKGSTVDQLATSARTKSNAVAYGTNYTLSTTHPNMDGLGRDQRIRWDAPKFFEGLTLATSAIEGGDWDVGAAYTDSFGDFKLLGRVGYASARVRSSFDNISTSFAVRHVPTTANLSMGFASRKLTASSTEARKKPYFYYAKLGYDFNCCSWGPLATSIDYYHGGHHVSNSSKSDSYGVGVVQHVPAIKAQFFATARMFKYKLADSGLTDFNNVTAVMGGMRVDF